jgi:hypothetical protein
MCQNVLTLWINILPDFVTINVLPLPEINFLVDVPLKTPEITKETAQYFGARKLIFRLTSKSDVKQIGVCSGGCEGSRADTLGVVEFDTVNKVFVGNHNIKEGTGWGADPVSSPDGKWIVLLGNDGGQYVRVLEAGKNGESSVRIPENWLNDN